MQQSRGDSKPVVEYGPPARRRRYAYVIAGAAAAVAVLARGPVVSLFEKDEPVTPVALAVPAPEPAAPPAATGPSVEDVRRLATERAQPALDAAARESDAAVAEHVRAIDDFFAQV